MTANKCYGTTRVIEINGITVNLDVITLEKIINYAMMYIAVQLRDAEANGKPIPKDTEIDNRAILALKIKIKQAYDKTKKSA